MKKHKHHIVPRSRGGSNGPTVLIDAYDHALLHAVDFLEGGPRFDFRHEAWPLLPENIKQAVIEKTAESMRGDNNVMKTPELRQWAKEQSGKLHTPEAKQNHKKSMEGLWSKHTHPMLGSVRVDTSERNKSEEMRRVVSATVQKTNLNKLQCPHCELTMNSGNLARHLKARH